MPQTSLDPFLSTMVLATLAVGLPILFVLAMRFLWDRNLKLDRSKELEKLIWQLHRIATAMEHQERLSFPAVQPGTEEAHDIAYLQQLPAQPARPATRVQAPLAAPAAAQAHTSAQSSNAQPTAPELVLAQASAVPSPAAQQQPEPQPPLQISTDTTRHGVNSMF